MACGAVLRTLEYQARSADEAPRTTTTCPSCPIDASKISLTPRTESTHRGLTGMPRRLKVITSDEKLAPITTMMRVHIECQVPDNVFPDSATHITCAVLPRHTRSVSVGGVDHTRVQYNTAGVMQGCYTSVTSTSVLGVGARLELLQLYMSVEHKPTGVLVAAGWHVDIDPVQGMKAYLYKEHLTNKVFTVVELSAPSTMDSALQVVNKLYTTTCPPKSLRTYMSRRSIAEYANLSPRAWDVSVPPDTGYRYTSKPDGERFWLVLYGFFWYMCSVSGDRNIIMWKPVNSAQHGAQVPVICDTEYVIGSDPIFIDCLTTRHGTPVPVTRDLAYSLNTLNDIKQWYPDCPQTVRTYFDTNEEAEAYSLSQRYPTDGTLGIRDGSTETVKVKAIKGADLLLEPGGNLVTGDGDIVANVSDYPSEFEDKVVEIRFTANANTSTIEVSDMFPRTNKTKANSTEAVMNILDSCVRLHSTSDRERTLVVKWCNNLRKKLIQKAVTCDDTRHVILDIGTGTGQSLDDLKADSTVSYVYIEPDEDRATKLARRAGARIIHCPAELGYAIKSLKTRRTTQIVLNCALSELCIDTDTLNIVMPEVKCVIATFSAQYIIEGLRLLHDNYHCKIIACMYTYDEAHHGVLVNGCGAHMYTDDGVTAKVKWGREKEYTEPVTLSMDYHGLGNIVLGTDILMPLTGPDSAAARVLCSKIRVITP